MRKIISILLMTAMIFAMMLFTACGEKQVSYEDAMSTLSEYIETNGQATDSGEYRIEKEIDKSKQIWYQACNDGRIALAYYDATGYLSGDTFILYLPKAKNSICDYEYSVKASKSKGWEEAKGTIDITTVNGPTTSAPENKDCKRLNIEVTSIDNALDEEESLFSAACDLKEVMEDFNGVCTGIQLSVPDFGFTNYR